MPSEPLFSAMQRIMRSIFKNGYKTIWTGGLNARIKSNRLFMSDVIKIILDIPQKCGLLEKFVGQLPADSAIGTEGAARSAL